MRATSPFDDGPGKPQDEAPVNPNSELLAAWRLISELQRAGDSGQRALLDLIRHTPPAPGLRAWAQAAPISAETTTSISGGVVDKVVNIARAEAVVLQAPVTAPDVVPSQVPADTGPFAGREGPVEQVLELATRRDDSERDLTVLVISGLGGVGKTRLVLRAARLLRGAFPDGQLYLNLRGIDRPPPTPLELLGQFLRALGPADSVLPTDLDERVALFRSRLAAKQVLVVLDNAASAAQVRLLLPGGGGGCAVLVTSRSRLQGLEPTATIDLDVLTHAAARDVIASLLGPRRTQAEPDAVDELIELCGRLPLALHLAGRRLAGSPHRRVASFVERMQDERRRLDELRDGDVEVRTAFNVSYQALPSEHARLFRLMGLSKSPDLAPWSVARLVDTAVDEAQDLLYHLVEAHLVECLEDDRGEVRYRMHDLVALFAAELVEGVESEEERLAALCRLLHTSLGLAEHADTLIRRMGAPAHRRADDAHARQLAATLMDDPLAWFEGEREALVSLVQQARSAGQLELACGLAAALSSFFLVHEHDEQWQRTQELALACAADLGDLAEQARVQRSLGAVHRNRGDYPAAQAALRWSFEAFEQLGHRLDALYARHALSDLYRYLQRMDDAVAGLTSTAAELRALGDASGTAYCLLDLGTVQRALGRWPQARQSLEASLPVLRERAEHKLEAHALRELGIVERESGSMKRAVQLLEASLHLSRRLHHRRSEAHSLNELGAALLEQGRPGAAQPLLEGAYAIFTQLQDPRGSGLSLLSLGRLARMLGQHDRAQLQLERSIGVLERLGYTSALARALYELGRIEVEQGRGAAAERNLLRSASLLGPASDERLLRDVSALLSSLRNRTAGDSVLDGR